MKRRMIVTIAVLAAAVFAGMLLAFLSGEQETTPGQAQSVAAEPQGAQPISAPAQSAPPAPPESPESALESAPESAPAAEPQNAGYVIGEYEGWLAVYGAGSAAPSMVYDVLVRSLPEYDRARLSAGIPAEGDAELQRILEDYVS